MDGASYATPTPGLIDTHLLDTSPISRASDGGAVFDGGTIGLGSQSSINSHVISVVASTVVLDSASYPFPSSAGAILQSPHHRLKAPVSLTNGAVLIPGGIAATISRMTYAIPSDDSGLVVNGQTVPFPVECALQSVFSAAPTGFVIGGQSMALDGTAVTLDGTVLSLGLSGVEVGSITIPLTSAQTTEGRMDGLIMSGFGSGREPGATAGGGNESGFLA